MQRSTSKDDRTYGGIKGRKDGRNRWKICHR